MEEASIDVDLTLELSVDLLREFAGAADEQHLVRAEFLEKRGQPFDLGVEVAAFSPVLPAGRSRAWRSGKPESAARVLRNITRPVPNSSSSAFIRPARAACARRWRVRPRAGGLARTSPKTFLSAAVSALPPSTRSTAFATCS